MDGPLQALGLDLLDGPALLANQQTRVVRPMRSEARDIGIERVDAMNKSVRHKKVERPINRGGRRPLFGAAELIHELIGADRQMARAYELEHPPPHRRELRRRRSDACLGRRDGVRNAHVVVVLGLG